MKLISSFQTKLIKFGNLKKFQKQTQPHTNLRSKNMLKKSLVLGALAAIAMAPAAFANQVQSNGSSTKIITGNTGVGNVNGVVSNTHSNQRQSKFKSPFCYASGNQIQSNGSATGIVSGNSGYNNVSGVNANTSNGQAQRSACY